MRGRGKSLPRIAGLVLLGGVVALFLAATRNPILGFAESSALHPLFGRISPEFRELGGRIAAISKELSELPGIPPPAKRGSTGYLSDPAADGPAPAWVEFSFPQPRVIDAVSCVPAQEPRDLHDNEALSLATRMDVVLKSGGKEVGRFPFEVKKSDRPLRKTLPYFREFDPVEVDSVRIEDAQAPGGPLDFALGEVFLFDGLDPVVHEAEIATNSSRRGVAGVGIDYISDDQTGLGLAEMPEPHPYVGFRSEPKPLADFPIEIVMKWDEPQSMDEARLYPVGRLLGARDDAAGFPRAVVVEAWDGTEWMPLLSREGEEFESPGWNPVALRFGEVETDRLRLTFPVLWKATKRSAAILALAEIEPRLRGVRLPAAELAVSSPPQDGNAAPNPDGSPRAWGLAGLCDGMSTDGRIIPEREWLAMLARRAELLIALAPLEARLSDLGLALGRLVSRILIGAVLLFFGGLLWLIFRQQVRHRQEMLAVRNRLAADLHDDLGSNLSAISIYAQRLKRQIESPPDCLDPMQRLIRESLGSLKEMVSFTTPGISRPISLVARLREIAEIHCAETPHDFSVAPGLEDLRVSSIHRRCLRLFLKEAVNNAVRHSAARHISFHIRREDDREIWLSVADDGCGLPADVLGKEGSLPTLRLRAEEMDARFRAGNLPGGGCEVAVTIRPESARTASASRGGNLRP
ncbi:hypothetical protein HZ994_15000 [Akkermansiaceae bacterium]|nr:hypothetical protein HZ994_15000 [Akkermansiaceae bacterium]